MSPEINGQRVNFQDNSMSLSYGLWILFSEDDADDFQRWQFDNNLPSSYDQEQAQEAQSLFEEYDLDREFAVELAEEYMNIDR
jgi:hypothetical protein